MNRTLSRLLRAAAPVAVLALAGCAQTFDATTLGVPVSLASDAAQPAQGQHFAVRATALWFGWGALPISQPSLQKSLAAELVGGKSVADVRIRVHSRITDILVTVLSGGLLVPRAVEFEGTIVGDAGAVPAPAAAPPQAPAGR